MAIKDLTGQRFGRLTVTEMRGSKCKVLCDCGNNDIVYSSHLLNDCIKSCGCLADETRKKSIANITDEQRQKGLKIRNEIYQVTTNDGSTLEYALRKEKYKNNSTGVKGVYRHGAKFVACLTFCGKQHYCGIFETVELAAKARKLAEEKYFEPIIEKYKKEAGA